MTRLVVLGSGQDGGSPQLGHRAAVGSARTASSIAVVTDGGAALLFDVTPDVRSQQRALLDAVAGYRDRSGDAFDGMFLTHAHMGHFAGLVHFGKEAHDPSGIPCWGSAAMIEFLRSNEPWRRIESDGNLDFRSIGHRPVAPIDGVTVRAIAVPHRAEHTDTVAYSIGIEASGRRVLYVPDIDSWEAWPDAREAVAAHDVALLDATFHDATEVPGRDISTIPHPLVADTLARFGNLAAGRRLILTHLNHTNPAGDPGSAEAAAVRRGGFEIAADGMTIDL